MNEDVKLQILKTYINRRWLCTINEVEPGVDRYWPIRHDITMTDGIAMKGN